jgi:chemotaxis protein CheX
MSVSIDVEQGQTQISQVVSSVFETMLGLKVDPIIEGYTPLKGEGFTASVQFMGEEKGLASLHCTVDQALRFATAMLGEEPPEINSDVWDVLGEIANMVGGNLKCLLAPGGSLSVPLVAQGTDYVQRLCEPSWTTTVGFASEYGNFEFSMVRIIPSSAKHVHVRH